MVQSANRIFFNLVFATLLLGTQLLLGAGLKQILGPYLSSMTYLQLQNTEPGPFHVIVDQHDIFGCRIDKYYQQSQLEQNKFYVEINDDLMGNKDCKSPKDIRAGAVLEMVAKGGKDNVFSLFINSNSASQSDSIILDQDTVNIVTNESKEFWFFRIYDSEGDAFSARVTVSNLDQNGVCLDGEYQAFPLNLSFYQGGDIINNDGRLLSLDNSKASTKGLKSCSPTVEFSLSWESSPDPHPFRRMAIYIQKKPGVASKPIIDITD